MRITVFGGSGFLGTHVCDKLSDAGHKVTVFDQISSEWIKNDQHMIVGDMLNEVQVREAVNGAQAVFNFAGITDLDDAKTRPVDTVRYNILGNNIILDACHMYGIERFVFASSVYVYSKSGGFYRCSKQACELYIENYHEQYGLEYTILRYGSLYGSRDKRNSIYRFIHQALTENKITYQGSSNAMREYIHVEDASLASVEILKSEFANEHIILTGHQPMKVGILLKMIEEMMDERVELEFLNTNENAHYEISPYSFNPKIGKKLVPPIHVDLGQGLLHVLEELHQELHPELCNRHGLLVQELKK